MVITYNSLRKEFDGKVKALQRRCQHREVSEWIDQWWALGHSTGYLVKRCERCNRLMGKKKKTDAWYCKRQKKEKKILQEVLGRKNVQSQADKRFEVLLTSIGWSIIIFALAALVLFLVTVFG